jgi:hypothetical protein
MFAIPGEEEGELASVQEEGRLEKERKDEGARSGIRLWATTLEALSSKFPPTFANHIFETKNIL